MKTSTIVWIVVVVIVVVGGIYWFTKGNSNAPAATAPQTTATTQTTQTAAPALMAASNSQFPSYLTASNGMALYTYNKDAAGVSNCSGSCASVWPPYTVSNSADLTAGAGISGTVGTITRADGSLQVTYNGMPLYFFAKDTAGQVTGDGQGGFSVVMATAAQPQTTTQTSASAAVSAPATTQAAPATAPAYNY